MCSLDHTHRNHTTATARLLPPERAIEPANHAAGNHRSDRPSLVSHHHNCGCCWNVSTATPFSHPPTDKSDLLPMSMMVILGLACCRASSSQLARWLNVSLLNQGARRAKCTQRHALRAEMASEKDGAPTTRSLCAPSTACAAWIDACHVG
jgi:hypothetical protein